MKPTKSTHEQNISARLGMLLRGRSLPRPDDEIVDQGLTFDLATLNRRRALGLIGGGAVGLGLTACGAGSASGSAGTNATANPSDSPSSGSSPSAAAGGQLTEIPDETAGPYPGDGSNGPDVLEKSGVVRSDLTKGMDGNTTAEGIPMTLELTILDLASGGAGFEGVAVYVWHCDRTGGYSMYSEGLEDVD